MHNPEQQELAVELTASGHVVIVDLWGQWPGRRLPPMPDPVAQTTYSSRVSASLDPWPSISELPLPGMRPQAAQGPITWDTGRSRGTSPDIEAEAGDTIAPVSLLAIQDVNPWGRFPVFDTLPTPDQLPRTALAADPPADEAGVSSSEAGPAALLALLIGALGGSRQGRRMVGRRAADVALALLSVVVVPSWWLFMRGSFPHVRQSQ